MLGRDFFFPPPPFAKNSHHRAGNNNTFAASNSYDEMQRPGGGFGFSVLIGQGGLILRGRNVNQSDIQTSNPTLLVLRAVTTATTYFIKG